MKYEVKSSLIMAVVSIAGSLLALSLGICGRILPIVLIIGLVVSVGLAFYAVYLLRHRVSMVVSPTGIYIPEKGVEYKWSQIEDAWIEERYVSQPLGEGYFSAHFVCEFDDGGDFVLDLEKVAGDVRSFIDNFNAVVPDEFRIYNKKYHDESIFYYIGSLFLGLFIALVVLMAFYG